MRSRGLYALAGRARQSAGGRSLAGIRRRIGECGYRQGDKPKGGHEADEEFFTALLLLSC